MRCPELVKISRKDAEYELSKKLLIQIQKLTEKIISIPKMSNFDIEKELDTNFVDMNRDLELAYLRGHEKATIKAEQEKEYWIDAHDGAYKNIVKLEQRIKELEEQLKSNNTTESFPHSHETY